MIEFISTDLITIGQRPILRNYDLAEILGSLKEEYEEGIKFLIEEMERGEDDEEFFDTEVALYLAELGYIYRIIDSVAVVLDLEGVA